VASLFRNQETRERTIEAIMAVTKLEITKPGTTKLTPQRRATLIRIAEIPKVRMEMGRAINCKIGRIKVFTKPMTIAATTAADRPVKINPGTKYATTKRAKTLIAKRIINFITNLIMNYYLIRCQESNSYLI
jgi:hypothetical protein